MKTDREGPGMESGSQLRDVLSKRHRLLRVFLDGPKTKPELVSNIDQSRSTVDRAVAELLEIECIEPATVAGNEYRITLAGELALQTYLDYCETSAKLQLHTSLLNAVPSDAEVSKTFLSAADVHSSTKAPDVATQPAIELLPEATKLAGTAPVVYGEYFEVLNEWIQKEDSALELVLEKNLLDAIEDNYRSKFARMKDSESVKIYVLDEQIPYAIWLLDHETTSHAGITIYEDGGIKGSLSTDTPQAVRWAREEYDRYKTESSRVI